MRTVRLIEVMQLAQGLQMAMCRLCSLYHIPSKASVLASPIFPRACPPPGQATQSSKVPPLGFSFYPMSSSVLSITLSSGTPMLKNLPWVLIARPARFQWQVPTSEPSSYPVQTIRDVRDHMLCDCIIDRSNEAQSGEGIHLLVSSRVWIRFRDQLTYLGLMRMAFLPWPLCYFLLRCPPAQDVPSFS